MAALENGYFRNEEKTFLSLSLTSWYLLLFSKCIIDILIFLIELSNKVGIETLKVLCNWIN